MTRRLLWRDSKTNPRIQAIGAALREIPAGPGPVLVHITWPLPVRRLQAGADAMASLYIEPAIHCGQAIGMGANEWITRTHLHRMVGLATARTTTHAIETGGVSDTARPVRIHPTSSMSPTPVDSGTRPTDKPPYAGRTPASRWSGF